MHRTQDYCNALPAPALNLTLFTSNKAMNQSINAIFTDRFFTCALKSFEASDMLSS